MLVHGNYSCKPCPWGNTVDEILQFAWVTQGICPCSQSTIPGLISISLKSLISTLSKLYFLANSDVCAKGDMWVALLTFIYAHFQHLSQNVSIKFYFQPFCKALYFKIPNINPPSWFLLVVFMYSSLYSASNEQTFFFFNHSTFYPHPSYI